MARSFLLFAILLCVGCHGIGLNVGVSHSDDGFRANGSFDDSNDAASFHVDEDDVTTVYAEFQFQLTPQSVVLKTSHGGSLDLPRYQEVEYSQLLRPVPSVFLPPPDSESSPDLLSKIDELLERIDNLEAEVRAHEERAEKLLSWSDVAVTGGGTTGTVGVIAAALWYARRRREAESA